MQSIQTTEQDQCAADSQASSGSTKSSAD